MSLYNNIIKKPRSNFWMIVLLKITISQNMNFWICIQQAINNKCLRNHNYNHLHNNLIKMKKKKKIFKIIIKIRNKVI